VLPELAAKGYRIQFAFIDGAHTFDHVLIDFFYVDQMLEVGGVIVFDDVYFQAVNAVLRFVLSNRDYELVEMLEFARTGAGNRAKRLVKRFLRRLQRTDKDPAPADLKLFQPLEWAYSVAIRKVALDSRPWLHHQAF